MGFDLPVMNRLRRSGRALSPASLFATGAQGVIYDPRDLSTMFQDSLGTTPVTAPGQVVGLRLDKSGRGNHATQATAGARLTYGIEPKTGTRNRLVYSGFDGAVSGTPGTTPTGWSRFLGTPNGTSIYTPNSALLGGGSIRIQTTLSRYQLGQVVPVAANTSYIISVDCDIVSGVTFNNHLDWVAPPSGATVSYRLDGVSVLSSSIVPTGSHKLEAILSVGATAGNGTMRMGIGIQANNTGDITFSNPQLEVGSTATPYQKVVTAFEVTEAGVPTCHYCAYAGANSMATAAIDFTGTDKMSFFAGVRKLSTALGTIAELSVDSSNNNGAFGVLTQNATFYQYAFGSRGTINSSAFTNDAAYAAPVSNVLTGTGDISGNLVRLRVNGTQVAQAMSGQGTGNYGNHILYFGRRAGASLAFVGRDYGIVIVGKATSAAEINITEAWLAANTPTVVL